MNQRIRHFLFAFVLLAIGCIVLPMLYPRKCDNGLWISVPGVYCISLSKEDIERMHLSYLRPVYDATGNNVSECGGHVWVLAQDPKTGVRPTFLPMHEQTLDSPGFYSYQDACQGIPGRIALANSFRYGLLAFGAIVWGIWLLRAGLRFPSLNEENGS